MDVTEIKVDTNINAMSVDEFKTYLLQLGDKKESMLDMVNEKSLSIVDSANKSSAARASLKDYYGNSLLGIGNNDKEASFTTYDFSNDTLNWALWLALYNDSWVFKRAIDKPAQDMVRCGINIESDTQYKNDILRICKQHRHDFIELVEWGRLFGGSIAVMMFDKLSDEDYAKASTDVEVLKKIQASKSMKLYVTDRWYGVAPDVEHTVNKMSSLDYGKPSRYRITFANGKEIEVRHDYILRYENRSAPKLVKAGMLQGWGYAEGSHILRELMRDDKLKSSIQSLIDKALIEVIKMSGMRGVFMGTDKENETQLNKRLEMVTWGRNFNSLTFLDSNDEYQMNSFSGLSGLSELLQENMWQIAAALEMQGILFGDMKSGFANDSDALERYDEVINGLCESYLRPVYEKFLWMVFKWKNINEKIEFSFNSLLMKKQDKERIEGLKNFIDLCSQMLGDGVITPKQYAKAFQNYTTKNIVDFGLTDEEIEKIDERTFEESEDFDLSEASL